MSVMWDELQEFIVEVKASDDWDALYEQARSFDQATSALALEHLALIHSLPPSLNHLQGQHDQSKHGRPGGGAQYGKTTAIMPPARQPSYGTSVGEVVSDVTGHEQFRKLEQERVGLKPYDGSDALASASNPHKDIRWANNQQRIGMKQKIHEEISQKLQQNLSREELVSFHSNYTVRQSQHHLPGVTRVWGAEERIKAIEQLKLIPKQQMADGAARILIDEWAATSGDSDVISVAVQRRAQQVFGLKDAVGVVRVPQSLEHEITDLLMDGRPVIDAYLKATYENTQSMLKKAGVDEITLFRGVGSDRTLGGNLITGPWSEKSGTAVASLQPLSSFAYHPVVARGFGDVQLGVKVSRERIWSTAITGAGALPEAEVVVLGGNVNVGWTLADWK